MFLPQFKHNRDSAEDTTSQKTMGGRSKKSTSSSAATATTSTISLSRIIATNFDRYQRKVASQDDAGLLLATEACAGGIREEVATFLLNCAVGKVSINGNAGSDDDDISGVKDTGGVEAAREEAIGAILRCLDGAFATVCVGTDKKQKRKGKTSKSSAAPADDADGGEEEDGTAEAIAGEWTESVDAILQLVAALGCGGGSGTADGSVANALLDRAAILSDVASEGVRSYVCTFVGLCVNQLMLNRSTGNDGGSSSFLSNDNDNEQGWTSECIDKAGAILLPRLTDKAQSVRSSAIRACAFLFVDSTNKDDDNDEEEEQEDEQTSQIQEVQETITDALLIRLAHDSSFANRCSAVQSVPITEDTVPFILERVRDVKERVRVEALEVLMDRVDVVKDLTAEQRVDVLRFGLTSRCTSTHEATAAMLCGGWMKTLKFDPIGLLRLLDPVNNESVCDSTMRTIIGAATNTDMLQASLKHLSSPEVRAYKESVFEPIKVERGEEEETLDPPTTFYLRILCETTNDSTTMSASEKNEILGNFMPDVPALCEVVQKHLGRLVGSIRSSSSFDANDEDDDEAEAAAEFEEREAFICLQLLQLVKCADLQEEGSRRHLVSILYSMLCSQETPDDLIEACVRTMAISHDNENQFIQTVSEIIAEIRDEQTDDIDTSAAESEEVNALRQIRVLSILSIVLEQVSGNANSMALLDTFSDSIVAAVTTNNNLVREAGVSCLGKYALLMQESKVVSEFKPLLLQVASSKKEKIEVRAQALLALCDLALLFDCVLGSSAPTDGSEDSTNDVSFVFLLSEMLCHSNSAVVIVAAEIVAKLLFAGKLNDHPSMVAHLIVIFFDKDLVESDAEDDDGEEVKEIGSPIRLQQILSLFFPAFSIKSKEGRTTLMNSIKPLLSIANEKLAKKKKGKKATSWPIAKMVEYVCSNVDLGEQEEAKKGSDDAEIDVGPIGDGDKGNEQENPAEPSSTLMASIAISEFLAESSVSCTTTYLRAVCKIVGGADIILEEDLRYLQLLKRSMDEVAMVVTDNTAIRSLETLIELLEDVPDEENDASSDNDTDELADELEKTNLSDADAADDPASTSASVDDENLTDMMEEGKPANTSNTSVEMERRQLGELNA